MVTVSSAFMSSRRERIKFKVSTAGCAFKACAFVDVLRALGLTEPDLVKPDLGKTDLDNTDVARDHSFHCIANAESGARRLYYACGVNGFNIPVTLAASLPPAAVRVPKSSRRQIELHARQEYPCWRALIGELAGPVLGKAIIRQRLRGRRGQRAKALRRAVDDRDRHLGGDAPPVLPAMELREIVSAHEPDQAQAGGA